MKTRRIQSEIKQAEWRVQFNTEKEQEFRTGEYPEQVKRHMIRFCKKRRKQAQADLDYWREQFENEKQR